MSSATYNVNVFRDLVYSQTGGVDRLADLYLPQGLHGLIPVIVWVHGGGWRFGDRKLAPDLSRWFAERGFAIVSFDYRLSDEVKFPEPVVDVKTAVRWVRSIAAEYSLDPEAIGLWGSSAGGHLSACAALSGAQFEGDEHVGYSSAVQAVVDGYGPTDFSRIDQDRIAVPPKVPDAETVLVRNVLPAADPNSFESRHLGVSVAEDPAAVARANPVNYAHAGAPPFLILHGESDGLVPWTQSQLLYDALAAVGNEVTLVTYERLGHGFFMDSSLDENGIGRATVVSAGEFASGSSTVFALCEEFFRFYLVDRSRGFTVRLGASGL